MSVEHEKAELRARRAHNDAVVFEVAGRGQGIVCRHDLLRAGLSRHAVDRRLKRDFLHVLHVGVYRVGSVTGQHAREIAALLACPGGALSHHTAAAILQLRPAQKADDPVDITVPQKRQCRRRSGIRAHRATLASDEINAVGVLKVTSPARTILDLSTVLRPRALEQALATAERSSPDVTARVAELLLRYPRRSGTPTLREIIRAPSGRAFTRSEAEELLLALIRGGSLTEPQLNVVVHGIEVDFYWRRARLVVEVDGYVHHSSRRSFEKDRLRDSALAAAGIVVMRLTWKQLTEDRDRTLVRLAQALARRES